MEKAIVAEGSLINFDVYEMITNIIVASIIGFILSKVYQKTHKGLSYSQSFTQTIFFITVIVSVVMMVIGGSLARAFALVGALSIVRFRTVLKDTKDLVYIFSALAIGMAAGTSNYYLAVIAIAFFSLIAFIFYKTNFGSINKSEFILRFRLSQENNNTEYLDLFKDLCKRSSLLHIESSVDGNSLLQTIDISLKEGVNEKDLISRFSKIKGVSEVTLITAKNDIDY